MSNNLNMEHLDPRIQSSNERIQSSNVPLHKRQPPHIQPSRKSSLESLSASFPDNRRPASSEQGARTIDAQRERIFNQRELEDHENDLPGLQKELFLEMDSFHDPMAEESGHNYGSESDDEELLISKVIPDTKKGVRFILVITGLFLGFMAVRISLSPPQI